MSDFDAIAGPVLAEPGVERGTGFGTNPGLRVDGRIFAMLMEGDLVVKLPATRCAELVGQDGVEPLEIGTRRMRHWVRVPPAREEVWPELMREALGFVRGDFPRASSS